MNYKEFDIVGLFKKIVYGSYVVIGVMFIIGLLMTGNVKFFDTVGEVLAFIESKVLILSLLGLDNAHIFTTFGDWLTSIGASVKVFAVSILAIYSLYILLLQFIAHRFIMSDAKKENKSLVKNMIAVFVLIGLLGAISGQFGTSFMDIFISNKLLFLMTNILLFILVIVQIIAIFFNIYVILTTNKYKPTLYLIELTHFLGYIILIFGSIKLISLFTSYIVLKTSLTSFDYAEIINLPQIIQLIFTWIDSKIAIDLSTIFATNSLDEFFNVYAYQFMDMVVDKIFSGVFVQQIVVIVSALALVITSSLVSKTIKDKIVSFIFVAVTLLVGILMLVYTPIAFSGIIGIILIILALVHSIDLLYRYRVLSTVKNKLLEHHSK